MELGGRLLVFFSHAPAGARKLIPSQAVGAKHPVRSGGTFGRHGVGARAGRLATADSTC